jgi:hypothetical protein
MLPVIIAAGTPAHLTITTSREGEGGFSLSAVLQILGYNL